MHSVSVIRLPNWACEEYQFLNRQEIQVPLILPSFESYANAIIQGVGSGCRTNDGTNKPQFDAIFPGKLGEGDVFEI